MMILWTTTSIKYSILLTYFFTIIFLTFIYFNSFQTKAEVEEGEVEEEEGEVEDNGIANDTKPSREMSPNSSIDAENSVQSSRSSGNNT
jgi:hypothetical protein